MCERDTIIHVIKSIQNEMAKGYSPLQSNVSYMCPIYSAFPFDLLGVFLRSRFFMSKNYEKEKLQVEKPIEYFISCGLFGTKKRMGERKKINKKTRKTPTQNRLRLIVKLYLVFSD